MDRMATGPGLGSQIWTFARHFLEMCAAMCIGGVILNGLVFVAGPALLGYPDPRREAPELALLVIACNCALPMAAWMRFRGMAWRPTFMFRWRLQELACGGGSISWVSKRRERRCDTKRSSRY